MSCAFVDLAALADLCDEDFVSSLTVDGGSSFDFAGLLVASGSGSATGVGFSSGELFASSVCEFFGFSWTGVFVGSESDSVVLARRSQKY